MPKTFIDLFAGIGGFHWALKELDYKCLLAVEKDEDAQEIYMHNFPKEECDFNIRAGGPKACNRVIGDIRSLTRPLADGKNEYRASTIAKRLKEEFNIMAGDVGVICGGFPCQPFSKSGVQKGSRDETRGTLFRDILLLTKALEPHFLILENVRNLAGPKHKETLKVIIRRIKKLGYEIEPEPIVLSPHDLPEELGSPQVRDRVFILARKKGMRDGCHPKKVSEAVNKLKEYTRPRWDADMILDQNTPEDYRLNEAEMHWINLWEEFLHIVEGMRIPGAPIWIDAFPGDPTEQKSKPKDAPMPDWEERFRKINLDFYNEICSQPERKRKLERWLKAIRKNKPTPKGGIEYLIPASRRKFEWQANLAFPKNTGRTLKGLLIQFRPSGIRVKPATHYPALVAITQTTIIGPMVDSKLDSGHYRYITPKEAARLQGMDTIDFNGQPDPLCYKQLGNAVNVKVIKYLAEKLMA
jgi:DNA (cytosine-5)-methyltransferase 1